MPIYMRRKEQVQNGTARYPSFGGPSSVARGTRLDDVTAVRSYTYRRTIDYNIRGTFNPCAFTSYRYAPDWEPLATDIAPNYKVTFGAPAAAGSRKPRISAVEPIWQRTYFSCGGSMRSVSIAPDDRELANMWNNLDCKLASSPVSVGMNIPLAILELRDIPKTVDTVRNISGWLLGRGSGPIRRGLRSSIGKVVEGYLGAVFGVAPTANDIRNTLDLRNHHVGARVLHYKAGQTVRGTLVYQSSDRSWQDRIVYRHPYHGWTSCYWNDEPGSSRTDLLAGAVSGCSDVGLTSDPTASGWPSRSKTIYSVKRHVLTAFGKVRDDVAFHAGDSLEVGADPLSTLYELTPFSFVVDWFADLGGWIKNQNRLAAARYGGFYLDTLAGIWHGHRVVTDTYYPMLELSDSGSPLRYDYYGTGYLSRARVEFEGTVTRAVEWRRMERIVQYERSRYSDGVTFAKVNTHNLAQQGPFQWAAGVALAIQNCRALRNFFR